MAIYKRTLKSGKVRYDLCFYDDRGNQKWKTFKTKKEATDYEAKVQVAKRECNYADVFTVKPEYTTTFNELAEKYAELHQDQPSWRNSKVYVVQALQEEFGERKLSQITRLEVEQWRMKRLKTPTRGGQPRAESSVDIDMAHFRHILNKAKEWGLLQVSPFDNPKGLFYSPDNARDRFLSEEEIEALLNACPLTLRPIVITAIHTGLRKSNILNLRWEQVKDGHIIIEASRTKTKKTYRIPINETLAKIFKELRRKNELRSPYVFLNSQGKKYEDVGRPFRAALKRAGIRDFRFHDLRHTCASHLTKRGVPLRAVQEILCHADIQTTMRYAHLAPDYLKGTVNQLNDLTNIRQKLDKAQSE